MRGRGAAFVALGEAALIASDPHPDWREPLLGLGVVGAKLKRPAAAGGCRGGALALLQRGVQLFRSVSAA